jgi:trimeric autotransporter adhesin
MRQRIPTQVGAGITAIGHQALKASTGGNNTAVGYLALTATSGTSNTALGFRAGGNITTGAGNVCIGSGAEPLSVTDSNQFVVGTAGVLLQVQ